MFSSSGGGASSNKEYNPLSLDEFSDDDDDDDDNFVTRPPKSSSASSSNTTNNNNFRNHYSSSHYNSNGNASSNDNNNFNTLRQQQQMMMAKQDEGLEMLGQHVEQLGQMSLQIHDELHTQNSMLDDMDHELDQTTQQINYITQKTKDFIVASGGTSNFILILSLAVIAIVLFLLILYS